MHTAGVLSFVCDSIYLHSGDTPEAGHTRHTIWRKQTHQVIHTKEGIDPERGDLGLESLWSNEWCQHFTVLNQTNRIAYLKKYPGRLVTHSEIYGKSDHLIPFKREELHILDMFFSSATADYNMGAYTQEGSKRKSDIYITW